MSNGIHIRTFAAGCAFTLAVFAATSFGASAPKPTHGISTAAISSQKPLPAPSLANKFAALTRRVDALQNSDAASRQNIRAIANAVNDISTQAQEADDKASCVTAGYQAAWSPTGELVANNDEPGPSNFIIAAIDPNCGA